MPYGFVNMKISDESWSNSLREIGDIERPDHFYLTPEHKCVYFGDYTARVGWSHSVTNKIVTNIKKPPSRRGTAEWGYKQKEIAKVGGLIRLNLRGDVLPEVTFVPVPPSKPPEHVDYDDRIMQIARAIGGDVDVRPLLQTGQVREPAHLAEDRPGPDALKEGLVWSEGELTRPVGRQLILLDDVLVTGATFVACRDVLLERFPEAEVFGVFVARRVPINPFATGSI